MRCTHSLAQVPPISIFLRQACSWLPKELAPLMGRVDRRIVCVTGLDALRCGKETAFTRSISVGSLHAASDIVVLLATRPEIALEASLSVECVGSAGLATASIEVAQAHWLLISVGVALIVRIEERSHHAAKVEVAAILLTQDARAVLLVLLLLEAQVLRCSSVLIEARPSDIGANQIRRIR